VGGDCTLDFNSNKKGVNGVHRPLLLTIIETILLFSSPLLFFYYGGIKLCIRFTVGCTRANPMTFSIFARDGSSGGPDLGSCRTQQTVFKKRPIGFRWLHANFIFYGFVVVIARQTWSTLLREVFLRFTPARWGGKSGSISPPHIFLPRACWSGHQLGLLIRRFL